MSIATDARTYADSAVAQGRSALAHAGTALGQAGIALGAVNRRLLADAGKPVYAALGAADLVAASVTKRAEELPADAVQGLAKAQHTGQALIARAQNEAASRLGDLRGRFAAGRQTVGTLPDTARVAGEGYLTVAKSASESYLQTAKGVYASLTDRGEARAAELRKNPRLAKLLGQAGEAVGAAAGEVRDTVAPVAKSAFDKVAEPTVAELKPAKSTGARRTTASRSTAGKPAASKSTTSKPAASKSTTSKPAASKSTTSKA
jgi:hypothetical protein